MHEGESVNHMQFQKVSSNVRTMSAHRSTQKHIILYYRLTIIVYHTLLALCESIKYF